MLKEKVIWPWVAQRDEDFAVRRDMLKKEGYKEWKPNSKENGKWAIKFGVEAQTGKQAKLFILYV